MKNITELLRLLSKNDSSITLMVYPINGGKAFEADIYSSNACKNLLTEAGQDAAEAVKALDRACENFLENWEDASKMDKSNYWRLFEMGF